MRKRSKICIVAASPLTIHFFLKRHVRKLSEDFDVTLVYNANNDDYVLPLDLPAREFSVGIQRKMSPFKDVATLMELTRFFGRENFDIVVSVVPKAGLLGMLAAVITRTKHRVHIFQGEVWAASKGFNRWLLKSMDTITAYCATTLLAVSQSEKQFLERQRVARVGKVSVLGAGSISGVDLIRFGPNATFRDHIRRQYNIPDDAVVCLFLGRLVVDKGIRELVAAFKISACDNRRLWLMMVGPDEEGEAANLRRLVPQGVSDRIVIEGFTSTPEQYLAAADLLCLPSYREGFGMVMLEAAATNIPTIGSRIYGISDAIVENSTGLLVAVANVGELSDAISMLSLSSDERQKMGKAGRSRVEAEFEQGLVVDRYAQFFKELVLNEKIS